MIMQCQYVKARFIGWLFIACPMKTIDHHDVTAFGHSISLVSDSSHLLFILFFYLFIYLIFYFFWTYFVPGQ